MMNKLGAEAFGTFWLVLGGCGSAVLAAAFPQVGIGLLGVSLAFGLTVLTMAYAVGGVSAHGRRPTLGTFLHRLVGVGHLATLRRQRRSATSLLASVWRR